MKDMRKGNSTDWKRAQGVGNRKHKRGKMSEKVNFFHFAFPQVCPSRKS